VDLKRLLDTNAYVALRRGHGEVSALVRESTELAFSTIVVGELLFGFRNGTRYERNARELDELLASDRVSVLPVTRATADRFGRIAAALRKAGTPIPTNDIWIAAHAFESGAELLSFDRHFEAVPGLPWIHLRSDSE
jgi:tRNA(fMet)-specific endonuclease VapC